MGSAFPAEPWGRRAIMEDGHKIVLCAFADPDMVCHFKCDECQREEPHHITECGMFDQQRAPWKGERDGEAS